MITLKPYAVLLLVAGVAGVSEAKKEAAPATDTERLAAAVQSCDLPSLNRLIASGVSVSTLGRNRLPVDGANYHPDLVDPLSLASLHRNTRGARSSWWTLKCPEAVTALTKAGADPWKAIYYQNPRLDTIRPQMIALLRVDDNREKKGDSDKIIEEMTNGLEIQLRTDRLNHLGYPTLKLSEVRQKLRTSGFSAEDTMAPDRVKACQVLDVDSVIEGSMEDFRSASAGIVSSAGMRMKFALTDCKTGELLWRSDLNYRLAEGVLVRAMGGGKVKQIVSGFAGPPAVAFPPYRKK